MWRRWLMGVLSIGLLCEGGGWVKAQQPHRTRPAQDSAFVTEKGSVNLTDPLYGGRGDAVVNGSGTDNVEAWNLAVATLSQRGGILYIPPGRYNFASKPAALSGGIMVRCAALGKTVLVRKYTEDSVSQGFIDMDVAHTNRVNNSGGGIEDCTLYAEKGTTGGSAINIQSDATTGQGFISLNWNYITGEGTWNYNVRADGSLKTTAPAGVRIVNINNGLFFQSTIAGILFTGVNNASINATGIYTNTGDCLVIDGGTGGRVPTNYVHAEMTFCDKIKLGATQTTHQVFYSSPNTTTLTTSSKMSNLTVVGNVGSISGTMSATSASIGIFTGGKVLAGVDIPTSGGGKLETSNGITFPATQLPVRQRNTLDDYESDTFTPTVYGSTTAGVTTYQTQKGYYTKIGNLVHITIVLSWSNQTGTGSLIVGALPFIPLSDGGHYMNAFAVFSDNLVIGAGYQLAAVSATTGAAEIWPYRMNVSGGESARLAIDPVGALHISGTYKTSQ